MKKLLSSLLIVGVFAACGDNTADNNLESPSDVHPPAEAITDSTGIIKDSVIVPDTEANDNNNSSSDTNIRQ